MKRSKILIIDLANISHIVSHMTIKGNESNPSVDLAKECSKSIIRWVASRVGSVSPDKVIIAIEDHCWRKDYFPEYKSNRKNLDRPDCIKGAQTICESFFDNYTDFSVIKVRGAEGDDVIAVAALELNKDNDVIILSCDKDFHQLLKYPSIQILHPIKKEYYKDYDKFGIFMKYFRGDTGDNVPNIWKGLRETKIRNYFDNPDVFRKYLDENKDFKNSWDQNKKLIKLSSKTIPEDVYKSIQIILNQDHSIKKPDIVKNIMNSNNHQLIYCMKIFNLN